VRYNSTKDPISIISIAQINDMLAGMLADEQYLHVGYKSAVIADLA